MKSANMWNGTETLGTNHSRYIGIAFLGKMTKETKTWLHLEKTFVATAEQLRTGITGLNPSWALLLLGDGSPTKHLALISGSPLAVDIFNFESVGISSDDAPNAEIAEIAMPRHRRQVWLQNEKGERLGYAVSWWNSDSIQQFLKDKSKPIGRNVSSNKTELFRDIKSVFRGNSAELEKQFGHKGPFWGRYYVFWHQGRPLTLIYEVFSPALCKYLGKTEVIS